MHATWTPGWGARQQYFQILVHSKIRSSTPTISGKGRKYLYLHRFNYSRMTRSPVAACIKFSGYSPIKPCMEAGTLPKNKWPLIATVFFIWADLVFFPASSPLSSIRWVKECSDQKFLRAPKLVFWRCLSVSFGPFKHSFLSLPHLSQIGKPNSFKSKFAFIGVSQKTVCVKSPNSGGYQRQTFKVYNSKCRLFWDKGEGPDFHVFPY